MRLSDDVRFVVVVVATAVGLCEPSSGGVDMIVDSPQLNAIMRSIRCADLL